MKQMMSIFAIVLASSAVFASNTQPATDAAVALTKAGLTHMGDQLDIQVFNATETGRLVKVELGVGSVDHPARIHNCVTVSFDKNGYIKDLHNEVGSYSCE